MNKKLKHPTYTSLVLENLPLEDFIDVPTLIKRTACTKNQISAALHSLRKYKRADVVVEPDGKGWWFALPEDGDTRQIVHSERAYEDRPRKQRRKKT